MREHGRHEKRSFPHRRGMLFSGHIVSRIFMLIGILTVLYLLITYVLMPVLASLTVH